MLGEQLVSRYVGSVNECPHFRIDHLCCFLRIWFLRGEISWLRHFERQVPDFVVHPELHNLSVGALRDLRGKKKQIR